MWIVGRENGKVVVQDDHGKDVFRGDESMALLGFARAMHRLDCLHKKLEEEVDRLDMFAVEQNAKERYGSIICELRECVQIAATGAAPSCVHNVEPRT